MASPLNIVADTHYKDEEFTEQRGDHLFTLLNNLTGNIFKRIIFQ